MQRYNNFLSRQNFCGLLVLLLLGLGRGSAQGLLTPTVCVEYPPGQSTNYLARFGYISENSGNIVLGANTADNYLYPVRNPPGEPSTFVPGVTASAFTVLLPVNSVEKWQLNYYILTASDAYYSAANSTESAPLAYSPTCPVVIRPASLSYGSPGTYNNVFLGQVDSGPTATGLTVSALSGNPGISFSNLTYVPADTANPTKSMNPNSIYGTVTVTAGVSTNSVYLQLNTPGSANAGAVVPITITF